MKNQDEEILHMSNRIKLDNGLTLVYEHIPNVRSVAIGFWVACGSRNEAPAEQGISHLLEHMLFKGTELRSARKIAETIDAVGGHLNAFTTKEYTCYYVKILDQHLRLGLELLADMVINPLIAPEELEKEKNVILEEVRMYEDNPDELIYDLLVQTLLQDHPLGHPILGTPESILQTSRADLIRFKERFYTPDNSCLAIAGNFEVSQLLEDCNTFWRKLRGVILRRRVARSRPPGQPVCGRRIPNKFTFVLVSPVSTGNTRTAMLYWCSTIFLGVVPPPVYSKS